MPTVPSTPPTGLVAVFKKQSLDITVFPVGSIVWFGSNLRLDAVEARVDTIFIWIGDRVDSPLVQYCLKSTDGDSRRDLQGSTSANVFATKVEADAYIQERIEGLRASLSGQRKT